MPAVKVRLPIQSMRAGCGVPISRRLRYDQIVPITPIGTLTQNTARQSMVASRPPASSPRNCPASAVIWLTPSAIPRWPAGKASVRIAAEFAGQHRAAERLHDAPADQPQRAGAARERIQRQGERSGGEDREAHVVHPDPAEHVAEAAERDHQHRGDQQVAQDHPEQIADVARGQRIQPDAAEDGGQRDDHDRAVDGGDQHAERGVGQRDPLVAAADRGLARARSPSQPLRQPVEQRQHAPSSSRRSHGGELLVEGVR